MEGFEINRGLNHATNFVINDFSRFYLKIAKKRITESSKRDARKTLDVINYCLFNTLLLLAPITPFNTEKIYLENYKKKESIFLEKWPKFNEALIDAPLEKDFEIATGAITATLSSREKAGLRLRWPIRKATIEVTDDSAYSAIERLESVIEDYANVKQVVIKRVEGLTQEIRPLFQKIGPEFKENAGMVAEELKRVKPAEINESINKSGHFVLHTSKGNFNIGPEHFFIVQKSEESDAVTFRHGRVQVDKEVDKELVEEGMVREFERRVQLARKEKALRKGDLMDLSYEASPNFADIIRRNADKIKKDVGAKTLREGLGKESSAKLEEIEDEKLRVEIGKSE
jgi:isoleucyl-tRNA synthetase